MDESVSNPAGINRKRKLQTELVETPLPKHVCWGEKREYDPPPSPQNCESDQESANGSNSFHGEEDSSMFAYDEPKTDHENLKTCVSDEPCTTSSSWGATSNEIDLNSLETISLSISNFSTSDSVSISAERDCPHHGNGVLSSLNDEDHFLEFGSHADCCCSEYRNEDLEYYTDKEFENLFQMNSAPAGDFVLSSGRWSVNQDTQLFAPKPTIDKEFEQYFSNLML